MAPRATVQLLWQQVYQRLREDILTGRLSPGQRLTELAVAREMGTSQGPVREALKRLEEEGLVSSIPHSGTSVTQVDVAEMREVFILRSVVEGLMAAKACTRLTPADEAHLQRLVDELVEATHTDDSALISTKDLAFHAYVCGLSGHTLVKRIFRVLETQILRYGHVARQLLGAYDPARAAAEHQALLDALKTGDPDQAARAFQEHLNWSRLRSLMEGQ